jgi:FtsZ-binding cell division protein ZapB
MEQKVKKSWREASKLEWSSNINPQTETLSKDHINTGSLMRMADSLETIAKDKTNLERDVQYWKDSSKKNADKVMFLNNQMRGYKGRITTLLGQIARLNKELKSK